MYVLNSLCTKMWDYQEDIQIHLSTSPIDSIVNESDNCRNKSVVWRMNIFISCVLLNLICVRTEWIKRIGVMWTKKDKRPQKSEWHRVPLQQPYLCCSSWWDLVRRCPYILKKQLSWNLVKSTLWKNHALMPRAYNHVNLWQGKELKTCNATGVIRFFSFHYIRRNHETAQMFSYIIQLFLLLMQNRV